MRLGVLRRVKKANKMISSKLRLISITRHHHSSTAKTLHFISVVDMAANERGMFVRPMPKGELNLVVDNGAASQDWELGKIYYLYVSDKPPRVVPRPPKPEEK